jgi:hypothetical protein
MDMNLGQCVISPDLVVFYSGCNFDNFSSTLCGMPNAWAQVSFSEAGADYCSYSLQYCKGIDIFSFLYKEK